MSETPVDTSDLIRPSKHMGTTSDKIGAWVNMQSPNIATKPRGEPERTQRLKKYNHLRNKKPPSGTVVVTSHKTQKKKKILKKEKNRSM